MKQLAGALSGLLSAVLLTSGGGTRPAPPVSALALDTAPLCVHDVAELVGQPYVVGEQHRGVYRTLPAGAAADLTSPVALGRSLAGLFRLSDQRVRENVTLLIVDNFMPGWLKEKNSESVHGNLVLWHVDAILRGAGYKAPPMERVYGVGTWTYTYGTSGKTITVRTLGTPSQGLAATSPRPLKPVVDALSLALKDILKKEKRVVVNMSFGVLPCNLLKELEAYQNDWDKYRQAVQGTAAGADHDEFLRRVLAGIPGLADDTRSRSNPLRQLLRQFANAEVGRGPGKGYVLFYAAAGNYALPYPLYPAQWPEVVAVSARTPSGQVARAPSENGTLAEWSNAGEVATVGQWFMQDIGPRLARSGAPAPSQNIYYLGTSFASPTLAVVNALELAVSREPGCSTGGYRSAFISQGSTWNNRWYEDVLKSCLK